MTACAILRFFTLLCFVQLIQVTRSDHMPWSHWAGGMISDLQILWKDQCPGCINYGLEITFRTNGQTIKDHVCLELVTGCVYQGYFQHEDATPVVVTKGCPNQDPNVIETSFKCHSIQGFTFMSLLSDGTTVDPHYATKDLIHEDRFRRVLVLADGSTSKHFEDSLLLFSLGRTTFPPTYGFEMDVVIHYDDSFRTLNNGNDAAAKAQIEAIMAHVQTYYNLPSLGTSIKINVKRIEHASGNTWVAGTDLESYRDYVDALPGDENINAFIAISYRNNQPGTTGIAWFGTTCSSKKLRTSINEWFQSDISTAQTIAHELGHNLKFDHDFNEDPTTFAKLNTPLKYCTIESPPNNQCTETGSIMDYYQTVVDKWSCCTREDFQNYYNQVVASDGSFCLAEASAPATTTTTAAPATEVTEPPVFPDRFLRGIFELVALFIGSQIPDALAEVMKQQLILLALNLRQLGVS